MPKPEPYEQENVETSVDNCNIDYSTDKEEEDNRAVEAYRLQNLYGLETIECGGDAAASATSTTCVAANTREEARKNEIAAPYVNELMSKLGRLSTEEFNAHIELLKMLISADLSQVRQLCDSLSQNSTNISNKKVRRFLS